MFISVEAFPLFMYFTLCATVGVIYVIEDLVKHATTTD